MLRITTLDEIDHLTVAGRRIRWATQQTGSTGAMRLTGIETAIAEVADALGGSLSATQTVELLRKAYTPERIARADGYRGRSWRSCSEAMGR